MRNFFIIRLFGNFHSFIPKNLIVLTPYYLLKLKFIRMSYKKILFYRYICVCVCVYIYIYIYDDGVFKKNHQFFVH